jgi:hypothetical protein
MKLVPNEQWSVTCPMTCGGPTKFISPGKARFVSGNTMPPKSLFCLTCRSRTGRRRGCCWICHKQHQEAVRAGATTWAELEARGLAAPADSKGRMWMADFHRWLGAGK